MVLLAFIDGRRHGWAWSVNLKNYKRHIDAALYDLNPPKVTTLYALSVPGGPTQTVRYDDGTGDELEVPLGTTACEFAPCLSDRTL